jgi:glucose-6-phosphate isomerase
LSNSETIKKWFLTNSSQVDIAKHFVAVSTNIEKVTAFGILIMFSMWDWVGDVFSLVPWGLPLVWLLEIKILRIAAGANEMDAFKTADFENNMPVV